MQTSDSCRTVRLALVVGALGVVYGDIGTSPLYALRECFNPVLGIVPSPENVLGIVSLIFWSLTLIVTVKYLGLLMRADNRGEGGILALLSVALPDRHGKPSGWVRNATLLGVFGAALLYGDGIITPAVSVLGAVEGLDVATPMFGHWVLPITVVVLLILFSVQRFGTGKVGGLFGPVMMVWFAVLALLGLRGIWHAPQILRALSPYYAAAFLLAHGAHAFAVLGSVFLAVTGAEALYADMGHFGASPIRRAWFSIVFPGLLLNYLGEGALLLQHPEAARNPFYLLAPSWAILPLVLLATIAAVIASQALISGAYSLTMQAVQMGYLPRLQVQHTSHSERGQVFMPQVNSFLMVACLGLVLSFESSSRLAGAYGIAVSLTMLCTTILFFSAARRLWHWSRWQAGLVCSVFFAVELTFAAANGLKMLQGGWFPLAVGLSIFTLMTTWHTGRAKLRAKLSESYLPLDLFLKEMGSSRLHRVPGTAVFMAGNPNGTPLALLHNLRHNQVLHQRVVILTIATEDVPFIEEPRRLNIEQLCPDLYRVTGRYGFMEQPNTPALLELCAAKGLELKSAQTTFFLSRETIIPKSGRGMAPWRRKLFAAMSRNAQPATAFFKLPPNRVVELGMQVEV
jgi:KUP system potassium uptake protein